MSLLGRYSKTSQLVHTFTIIIYSCADQSLHWFWYPRRYYCIAELQMFLWLCFALYWYLYPRLIISKLSLLQDSSLLFHSLWRPRWCRRSWRQIENYLFLHSYHLTFPPTFERPQKNWAARDLRSGRSIRCWRLISTLCGQSCSRIASQW